MITKVKWKEHPILGDLEIDLAKEDGSPYKTIVFAGENGTGKTTILESLNNFLTLGDQGLNFVEYITYQIGSKKFKIIPSTDQRHQGFHNRFDFDTGETVKNHRNKIYSPDKIREDVFDLRRYGSSYSKARSGFSTKLVNVSSSSEQLDSNIYQSDDNDDYTEIKKLLINVSTQDNAKFMEYLSEDTEMTLSRFMERHSKLQRFISAFNFFFDSVTFMKVDHFNSKEKKILFKKNNKPIPIDSLSTGEKQIVFRGAYLLQNKENLKGGCIFVDEPELSMHPKWQRKILKFYQDLFTQEEEQFSQIMLATHSEYVLESAFNDDNTQVILLKQGECGVIAEKPAPHVLNYLTLGEVNYLVFDIASVEYHSLLYGYIQNNNPDGSSLIKTDDYISDHSCYLLSEHEKISPFQTWNGHTYKTLSTYIRNAIDHPEEGRDFESLELECSIKLMIEICKLTPPRQPSTP